MKNLRNKNEKGFTLIELLVVIAIIGLLASVVLLALNSARAKSRDAKRLADVRQIASALELMFNDKSAYPTSGVGSCTGAGADGTVALDQCAVAAGGTTFTPTYIGLIPTSPTPQDGSCSATQNTYKYIAPTDGSTYTLSFCIGATTGGYTCTNGTACTKRLTPAGIQ